MKLGKLVTSTGEVRDVTPANGKSFELKELQELVGGYIQILSTNEPRLICVMNEDGKVIGLPRNRTATSMLSEIGMMIDDFIVGDVLICPGEMVE